MHVTDQCHNAYAGTDESSNSIPAHESRCCVIIELYLEVEDAEIESTGRWIGESKSPS